MLGRPRSQGPVQPSSMEQACEEQVLMAIHHSTALLAGQLTDKRCLYTKILPNIQPLTKSSEEEEVCVCVCVCVCVWCVCVCTHVCVAGLEDHSHIDTPKVTREEVERAAKKLQNGKPGGDDRIVAELMKSGGETMMGWLVELI